MKLTRKRRMRQWGEFQAVRNKGRSAGGRFLVLGAWEDSSSDDQRFGFITSKKASKKAVVRNLLRRQFREIVRKHGDSLRPQQMVVTIARWRASQATFAELEADWIKTAKKLKIWRKSPADPS
jgi:ribonuclease P protein component